ncbi:MAG: hypothetical protein UX62_C0059G0003 [Microgenomates group bacterium GW2011_GWA2_46_7]|nr:MAG: hypothetical protein UX62_C0059G0003 [Microgenomates group bacterium GW2011_GWA2_46_7]KKU45116.1 MAG: hypothetical protein UX64_C0035G0002 [Microgenomates group bacterium GW2011_GWC2_46_7]
MVDLKKEKEPLMEGRVRVPEELPTVEAPRNIKENLEVESWVEKIEKRFGRVPNKTSDANDDSVVIQQPQSTQPPVVLPINQQQIQVGKKAKPELAIAWLVTWMLRQIKILTRIGRKVRIQDIPEVK